VYAAQRFVLGSDTHCFIALGGVDLFLEMCVLALRAIRVFGSCEVMAALATRFLEAVMCAFQGVGLTMSKRFKSEMPRGRARSYAGWCGRWTL
jgi:hypothetical protein